MTHTAFIQDYFTQLGLEPEVAILYLALHTGGPQTISQLARTSGVERTRIYRLIDHLTSSGLIEVETQYKRSRFRAAPIANLRLLISQREQTLRSLQAELGTLEQLLAPASLSSPATRVQFYRGPEGAKQMFWNETTAQGPIVSLLYENMQIRTDSAFFERWVRTCNERGLRFRGLISDEFISSQQTWYARHTNERLQHWEARYLPKTTFSITHGLTIYDDVVAFFNWRAGEIFGIEIYNAAIAATHRQLYELLWAQGHSVDDLTGTLSPASKAT